jgi:uncharacterized protein
MRSINGQILKQMVISAANNLYNHYPEIDALNVFPVPDGDTGMNMNLTLTSGAKEVQNRNDDDVYTIANLFSRGLLMGARGNSGVITSQIFRGFAASLKDKKIIKVEDLVDAFSNGSSVAYKAVMRPVEGTILTVIRESSESLADKVTNDMSIEKAMSLMVSEAKASLKRTPDLLPVLKEVGVVDSGGAGLVKILEGMECALNGVFIEKNLATSVDSANKVDSGETGYNIEFTLNLCLDNNKNPYIENRFISVLESRGDSVELESKEKRVSVKLHSMNPGSILTYAQSFGEFVSIKIDNLSCSSVKENEKEINIAPVPVAQKKFAIVAISAGKGIDDYFKEIGVDKIVSGGQTMNPSIEDIISAIRSCQAKTVFVLPNNSNIIMAALQAADVLTDEIDVRVISTKTIPQGIVAASSFNPDSSVENNLIDMKASFAALKSGAITYAIKDTTIDGFEVTKNYFMGIYDKKIVVCEKNKINSLYKLLEQMIDEDSYLVSIFIGEDVDEKDAEKIRKELPEKFRDVEFDIRDGNQPVYSFLLGVE